MLARVIFKAVGDHALPRPRVQPAPVGRAGADPGPARGAGDHQAELDLEALFAEDSTYFGDLFAHVVQWRGDIYLEDGLHRALRAALQQRPVLHARVLELPD